MIDENLLSRVGENWFSSDGGSTFNSNDFEFSQYFESKKVTLDDKKEVYLWKIKKKVLKEVDAIFFNLPGYQKAIFNICQLTIGKGVLAINEETTETKKELADFLASFPGGQLQFFWETCRLILTKGNCLIYLTDFGDEETSDYKFVNINPENFGVLNPSNKPIGKYLANEFVYIFGNTVKFNADNLLDNKLTLHLKSKLSGILGVPPTIINSSFSNAILKDILSFQQTKSRGGFKKQVINFFKKDNQGNEIYLSPNSSDNTEKVAMAEIKKDINNAISNPNTHSVVVGQDFKIGELLPAENNQDFKIFINEIYPLYIANLAGVAPYSLLPPKSVNRNTTEEQYKEMIQNTIQPLNNFLSEKIQKLYEIWCKKLGTTPILELTLDNPKPELSIQKSVADILKAAQLGLIDIDEARNELGLNPASDEQKAIWEKKSTQKIDNQAIEVKV